MQENPEPTTANPEPPSTESQGTACGRVIPKSVLPKDFAVGGQAVLEGVMMRGPNAYAVAVRRPQGDIHLYSRRFWPVTRRKRWLRLPIVRGAVSLFEMLVLGYKALDHSANVVEQAEREKEEMEAKEKAESATSAESEAPAGGSTAARAASPLVSASGNAAGDSCAETREETGGSAETAPPPTSAQAPAAPPVKNSISTASVSERPISRWTMAGVFAFSMSLAVLLFIVLPNVATHLLGMLMRLGSEGESLREVDRPLLFNLVAGGVRAIVILCYIWAISFIDEIRRLFQYHGAEHKVVMAFEKGLPLDIEHIRPVTTLHPRCGTTFIAIVILVSIIIFAVLAAAIVMVYPPFATWNIVLRKALIILLHIVFLPVVAGVAYEITRRAGKRPDYWLYRILLTPGFLFQRITTREPDDDMIEVSLKAFHEALQPRRC